MTHWGSYQVHMVWKLSVFSSYLSVVQILIRQGEKANYHLIKSAGEVAGGKRL